MSYGRDNMTNLACRSNKRLAPNIAKYIALHREYILHYGNEEFYVSYKCAIGYLRFYIYESFHNYQVRSAS